MSRRSTYAKSTVSAVCPQSLADALLSPHCDLVYNIPTCHRTITPSLEGMTAYKKPRHHHHDEQLRIFRPDLRSQRGPHLEIRHACDRHGCPRLKARAWRERECRRNASKLSVWAPSSLLKTARRPIAPTMGDTTSGRSFLHSQCHEPTMRFPRLVDSIRARCNRATISNDTVPLRQTTVADSLTSFSSAFSSALHTWYSSSSFLEQALATLLHRIETNASHVPPLQRSFSMVRFSTRLKQQGRASTTSLVTAVHCCSHPSHQSFGPLQRELEIKRR